MKIAGALCSECGAEETRNEIMTVGAGPNSPSFLVRVCEKCGHIENLFEVETYKWVCPTCERPLKDVTFWPTTGGIAMGLLNKNDKAPTTLGRLKFFKCDRCGARVYIGKRVENGEYEFLDEDPNSSQNYPIHPEDGRNA